MDKMPHPGRPARRRAPPTCLALALAISAAACGYEPGPAPMRFALNASTQEALEDAPEVADHVQGSLEMLFGTPQNPAFAVTSAWVDEERDPNHAEKPADGGGTGEITPERMEEIRADNARAYATQLAAIDVGRHGDVVPQKAAPALNAGLAALLAARRAGGLSDADLRTQARELFTGYYPGLRDSAELYRQQCLHCHGVEGGGDGPTSRFLDPRPRDYRKGIFKFTAVKDKARPRREDLYRVLDQGVYGTAMPSFRRYSIAEREGLVDYVRLLAIRGEVEGRLVLSWQDEEALPAETILETYLEVWDKWSQARDKVVAFEGEVPPPTPELLARGRELFNDAKKGNCASCHGERGLGDGPSAFKIDERTGKRISAYQDDWGHDILPRNLALGLYRGGARPIDVYRRIYAGINGGPMPALGESKDAQGNPLLSSEDMWALVHYVRSLSQRDERVAGSAAAAGAPSHGSGAGAGSGSGD